MGRQHTVNRRGSSPVVGSIVKLTLCDVTGVIVDLVLDEDLARIEYAVIAFDTGLGEVTVYQPVSWNLLRPLDGGFSLIAKMGEDADELPESLHANPVVYGGNSKHLSHEFVPTPQSRRVH